MMNFKNRIFKCLFCFILWFRILKDFKVSIFNVNIKIKVILIIFLIKYFM